MRKILLILLLTGILLPSFVFSFPLVLNWKFAGWSGGGAFSYIYVDPSSAGTVWMVSDVSGIFKSTNQGDSWNWSTRGMVNVGGSTIIQAPSNPSVFYHASGRTAYAGAVHKSSDGGATWVNQGTGPQYRVDISGHKAIAVDRSNPNIAYLGNVTGDIYRTTDGTIWSLWLSAAQVGIGKIHAMAIDRTNTYLWAGSSSGLRRIRISDGTIFPIILTGANALQNRDIAAVAIAGVPYVFAAAGGRIAYTSNDGATWSYTAPLGISSANCINRIALAPGSNLNGAKIMAAYTTVAFSYNGGKFRSFDGGSSWSNANGSINYSPADNPTRAYKRGWGLALSLNADASGTRWYGTDYWGAFRSDDFGGTWNEKVNGAGNQVLSDVRIAPDGSIYAASMDNGLMRSTDGVNWTMLIPNMTPGQNYPQVSGHVWKVVCLGTAADWANGQGVVVATNYAWDGTNKHQILRGTGQGGPASNTGTWSVLNPSAWPHVDLFNSVWEKGYMRGIALDPNATGKTNGKIWITLDGYSGTNLGGVFVSTDAGQNFVRKYGFSASNNLKFYNGIAVNPTDSNNICAATFGSGGGILCSRDGGSSWSLPVRGNQLYGYDIKSGKDGAFYWVGDVGGPAVYRSMDKGFTWAKIWHAAAKAAPGDALEVDPANPARVVVSATNYDGKSPNLIFMSENANTPDPAQVTWTDITGSLPDGQGMATCAFRGSEGAEGFLYCGRYAGGIFKLDLVSSDTDAPSAPSNLAWSLSGTEINLSWVPSTDNLGVKDYQVYNGKALLGTTTSTSYTHNGVLGATYAYAVKACDAAHNTSAASNQVSVRVPSTIVPPPGNLTAAVENSGIRLRWTASTSTAVRGYNVYRNGTYFRTYSTISSVDQTAVKGTAYTYKVQAYDAGNRKSNFSNSVTVT
ncbi:MAG: hypothetical protein HY591_07350, partial [Candidatus Omnitrophica bacterium]|nr:hypothetical protein [Candidatus Omnitrophota bacterium]